MAKKSKSKNIVEAVASVAGRGLSGRKDQVATLIEKAMSQAVQLCYDKGIRDPDIVRATQLKARELAMQQINEKLAEK